MIFTTRHSLCSKVRGAPRSNALALFAAVVVLLVASVICRGQEGSQQPSPHSAVATLGPLRAWLATDEQGRCQLHVYNTGSDEIVAWTVTLRIARTTGTRPSVYYGHDAWLSDVQPRPWRKRLPPAGTVAWSVESDDDAFTLDVRLVVLAAGVAFGEPSELQRLVRARDRVASEAREALTAMDLAIRTHGAREVLRRRLGSSLLQRDDSRLDVQNLMRSAEEQMASDDDERALATLTEVVRLLRELSRDVPRPRLEFTSTESKVATVTCNRR